MIRTLSFEKALGKLAPNHSFNGCDKDRTIAKIMYSHGRPLTADEIMSEAYKTLPLFPTVRVGQHGSNKIETLTKKNEIPTALSSMGFILAGSRWFEESGKLAKDNDPGYIYLIRLRGTNFYKIGLSSQPDARIKSFSVEFPIEPETVALFRVPGMKSTEQLLHEMFFANHHKGEWFDLEPDDVTFFINLMEPISDRVY